MRDIKGVLLDMDGVLVDSEDMGKRAFLAAIKDYGVIAKMEDFHDFIGGGAEPVIRGVMEKNGGVFVPEVITRAYDIYEEYAQKELQAFAATNKVIKTLYEKGYKLGVCSSGNRRRVNINIKYGKIDTQFFSAIISGEDVARKKPYPDIYLKGAKSLGLDPSACVAVEDAINGIKAAHAAGMKSIAVTTSFSERELKEHNPEYIINDIAEVLNIL
ncbi:MAG TPA: HAD family phosphatase [Clostridiales bacterium]|nr:HAD family phosphatase [Clostridiales bacterium]